MNDAYKRQLEEIYKSNYERHIRYATFLLHNSNLAEDMVHKAFLLAIENEEKSKGLHNDIFLNLPASVSALFRILKMERIQLNWGKPFILQIFWDLI